MAAVTSYGSRIMDGLLNTVPAVLAGAGEGGGVDRVWTETLETGAADSTSSLYVIARLPSNARLLGASELAHDALGATTATFDIGVYNIGSRSDFTDDPDAINAGVVCSTAGDKKFISGRELWGQQVWEFINGVTVDPGVDVDIKLVLNDAHLSSGGGTVTASIHYAVD